MKSTNVVMVFLAVACLLLAGCQQAQTANNANNTTGTACTEEAKICPDGSSVGRTGPNCEFAACPTPTSTYREYKSEDPDMCARMRFTCDGAEMFGDETGCGCIRPHQEAAVTLCSADYNPVCGTTANGQQTYPNDCQASVDPAVTKTVAGECAASGKVGENSQIQFSYQPKQCQEAPWDAWYASGAIQFIKAPTDADLIVAYYGDKGISVSDVQRIESDRVVCQACDICPTTHSFTLKARAGDKLVLSEDGWTSSEVPADRKVSTDCTEPRSEACTKEYMPVCGDNGQTYGNKCTACADTSVNSYVSGACEQVGSRRYISNDAEACKAMFFTCEEGEQPFFADDGCGCEQALA